MRSSCFLRSLTNGGEDEETDTGSKYKTITNNNLLYLYKLSGTSLCLSTNIFVNCFILSLVRSLFEKYFLSFTENISSLARLLRYVATTVRAGAWSPLQESITSTGVFRVAASGPLYTLYTTTTVHTVHRVKYTPCVRKFYNFAM